MPAWRNRPVWRVLDTDFSNGARFLALWASFEEDPHRPRVLHYVGIADQAPALSELQHALDAVPALAAHSGALQHQWQGLSPGFHRMELSAGRVLLTLCIGPLQSALREQEFMTDAVLGPHPAHTAGMAMWDRWTLKALVRLCRPGTTLEMPSAPAGLLHAVCEAGFVLDDNPAAGTRVGRFQPRWEPAARRHPWRGQVAPVTDCAIIGAGLAGATTAASLARRGWKVTVLDAAPGPAAGASGLPVGLLVPQVTRDEGARTRLTRAGVHLTHQWCQALLDHGADWSPCGVRQLRLDAAPPDAVWHADGAWIKPARLVAACLERPGVLFLGNAGVTQIVHDGDRWLLLGVGGAVLARCAQLVIAAAGGSMPLLEHLRSAVAPTSSRIPLFKPMQIVGGQVSWGLQLPGDAAHLPAGPVNGHGSFVPHVPVDGAYAWFAGASYETDAAPRRDAHTSDLENLERLATLLPDAARALGARFVAGDVRSWHASRCATPDRLPVVGPLHKDGMASLWISSAMGSRGLSYAVLCAEILAARLGGEPLPVEGSLARLLAATRPGLVSHHL